MKKLVSIFAACALFVGVAVADEKEKSATANATFKSLDRNGDDRLTISEVEGDKMLKEHFAMIDADRDGQLTPQEYSEHMRDMKDKSSKKDY